MQRRDCTTILQFLNLSWQPGPFSNFPGFPVGMMSLLMRLLSCSLLLFIVLDRLLPLLSLLLLLMLEPLSATGTLSVPSEKQGMT